ncbi:MAG: hypothetical protein M3Z08_17225 [Chloroflexota bacterium]|nr:hypothetical protein [Chloroflexota bacterium]
MVPPVFETYFATIVGASAALVGLLFVAISIAPERTVRPEAPLEQQAMATSCFIALCNPFFIALMALIPSLDLKVVGMTTLAVSTMGLMNTCILGWFLLRHLSGWRNAVRRSAFVLISLALYGGEFYIGMQLNSHAASATFSWLALMLVGLNALGLSRAWDLLGAHRYRFQDLLTRPKKEETHQE